MKIKLIIFLIFSIIIFKKGSSQEVIYLDENMKKIDSVNFSKKCKARVLGCLEYKRKQIIVYSVYKHHDFGRLSQNELEKVKLLLNQNSNDDLKKNQSYVVRFRDSLYGYFEKTFKRLQKTKKIIFNDLSIQAQNEFVYEVNSTVKRRVSTHFEHIKSSNKKCIRLLKKVNTKDYYVFNEDVGYIEKYGENKYWIKNDSILNRLFFKQRPNVSYVIIKPNGNYFASNRAISRVNFFRLIKEDDWTKFEQDLIQSINKNSISGIRFFQKKNLFADNECIVEY